MDDLDDILRRNPKAARGMDSIKGALDALGKLRKAGLAQGAAQLMPPHSGRYGGVPRPTRGMKVVAKS